MKYQFTIKVDNMIENNYSVGDIVDSNENVYCKLSKFIIIGISHVYIDEMRHKIIIEGDCVSVEGNLKVENKEYNIEPGENHIRSERKIINE